MDNRYERLNKPSLPEEKRKLRLPTRAFVTFVSIMVIALSAGIYVYDLISAPEVTVIGEAIKAGSFTYEIIKVSSSKTIGQPPLTETAEGIYKTVEIAVLNSADKVLQLDQNVFTIIDAEGIEYFPVCRTDLGDCVNVPDTFTLSRLQPGEETIGVLTFDVDPLGTGYRLRIIIEPVSGKSVYFKLD